MRNYSGSIFNCLNSSQCNILLIAENCVGYNWSVDDKWLSLYLSVPGVPAFLRWTSRPAGIHANLVRNYVNCEKIYWRRGQLVQRKRIGKTTRCRQVVVWGVEITEYLFTYKKKWMDRWYRRCAILQQSHITFFEPCAIAIDVKLEKGRP